MKRTRYEVLLRAVQPIAHAEGTVGNATLAMRRKVRTADGDIVSVPIVTADTMRHQMREAAAMALLDGLGMLESPQLTEAATRLLFNGGMLTSKGAGGGVKLADFRAMNDLIPSLALFGGCANGQLVPGQLEVSDAVPVAEETTALVPEWMLGRAANLTSARELLDEEQRVRFDPMRDPSKTRLLEAGARDAVERKATAREEAHDSGSDADALATKSTMLPRTCEVIIPGTLLAWSVTATTYDALQEDTFAVVMGSFLRRPIVGGKRGTGHGLLEPLAGNEVPIARPADAPVGMDLAALSTKRGDIFRAHVRDQAAAIRAALAKVAA
jgi:CRISPR type IV-associated protein Csf2